MKALPELPTMSAAAVAAIGAAAAAPGLARASRGPGVQIALEVRPGAAGLAVLVDGATGAVWGLCASESVAARTRNFFR